MDCYTDKPRNFHINRIKLFKKIDVFLKKQACFVEFTGNNKVTWINIRFLFLGGLGLG